MCAVLVWCAFPARRTAETGPSFGAVNVANHGACHGQSFRVGAAAALGGLPQMPHGKTDWKNASFGLFIGAAPAQLGKLFQRQGRELAETRVRPENTFRYVVVSPILPTSPAWQRAVATAGSASNPPPT